MVDYKINREEKVFGEKLEGIEYIDRVGAYGIAFDDEGRVYESPVLRPSSLGSFRSIK